MRKRIIRCKAAISSSRLKWMQCKKCLSWTCNKLGQQGMESRKKQGVPAVGWIWSMKRAFTANEDRDMIDYGQRHGLMSDQSPFGPRIEQILAGPRISLPKSWHGGCYEPVTASDKSRTRATKPDHPPFGFLRGACGTAKGGRATVRLAVPSTLQDRL